MGTVGIYAQIPFCASKCSFCNFSSRVAPSYVSEGYCSALEHEATTLPENLAAAGINRRVLEFAVDTLYVGGGTPLIVGIERLRRTMEAIRRAVRIDGLVEFTMEVTPGSGDNTALQGLRSLGVNRLSVGAQTFNDRELRSVGRLHTAEDTKQMISAARRAAFTNVSLDLIAGLPYQTDGTWGQTLETLARVRPEHVSVYIFEIDEASRLGRELIRHGTRFHSGAVPDEDFSAEAYEKARALLAAEGYRQYEISNFALRGYESVHNKKYWQLEPYLGLGAGAHSFDGEHRWSNEVSPQAYQNKLESGLSPIDHVSRLSLDEQLEEFFFLGLRQAEGVDLTQAERRWGLRSLARWKPAIASLAGRGLIEQRAQNLRLTENAYLVSNEVFQEFLN